MLQLLITMGRSHDIRVQVNKAREAYEIACNPDITMIYTNSIKWGIDPDVYKDSDAPYLTHIREFLRDMQIDYRTIIQRVYNDIAKNHGTKRAQRLIDWLKPGGDIGEASYWQRMELKSDRKRLERLIARYNRSEWRAFKV